MLTSGLIVTSKTIGKSYIQMNDLIKISNKLKIKVLVLCEPHPKSWVRFVLLCKKIHIIPIIIYEHNNKKFLLENDNDISKCIKFYNKISLDLDIKELDLNIPYVIYPNDSFKKIINQNDTNLSIKSSLKYSDQICKKISNIENINYNFSLNTIFIPKIGNIDNLKKFIDIENVTNIKERERINYELEIIEKLNVSDYILTVKKIVDIANDNNIFVGPGRGSAVSSLIVNKLNITKINPLFYNLLFERFLNVFRKELPDIDLDVDAEKRNYLIELIAEYFGKNNVSYIRTFSTMKSKSTLKKAEKILNEKINYKFFIPYKHPNNLKNYDSLNKKNKIIFNLLYYLEGLEIAESIHAAGIIISNDNLLEKIPISGKEINISEWTYNDLKLIGAEKFDILSLDTLTTIKKMEISPKYNLNNNFNYDYLNKGFTKGIFQLDSFIGKKIIKTIKPKSFQDIINAISLNRPGPLKTGMLDNYIFNNSSSYLSKLFPETNGVILFQEQIMLLTQKLGGFSKEDSDLLRKSLSKKNDLSIDKLKNSFISNASKTIGMLEAKKIFDTISEFAKYSFNKSHAVAYAHITFFLIKEKFENAENFFYYHIINKGLDIDIINEMLFMKIKLFNPDIRYPYGKISYKSITLPLKVIKGIGQNLSSFFLNSKIYSFLDFINFCKTNNIGRNHIELIIKSGAVDHFSENRKLLLRKTTDLIRGKNEELIDIKNTIFGDNKKENKNVETNLFDYIKYEFDTIQFPISVFKMRNLSDSLIEKYVYEKNIAFDGYFYKNYIFDNSAILEIQEYSKEIKKVIKEM